MARCRRSFSFWSLGRGRALHNAPALQTLAAADGLLSVGDGQEATQKALQVGLAAADRQLSVGGAEEATQEALCLPKDTAPLLSDTEPLPGAAVPISSRGLLSRETISCASDGCRPHLQCED